MYQVGVVGCGVIGQRLAGAFAAHPDTAVWGACDLVASRVESFAAEHDCRAFTDHRELVARPEVDLVHVGVPPLAHREVVADALGADVAVICEKPIAADAETGREMVALARESDRPTAVNLPFRYAPGFHELADRLDAGDVGTPRRIRLDFRFPRWPRGWQDVDWLRTREQGGPLREVGTHFLFGVQELFGPVEQVAARVRYSGPDAYEDSIAGHFTAGAVDGVVDLACDHAQPEENSLTVLGTDGELSFVEWYRLLADRGTPDERVLHDDRGDATAALVEAFVDELDGDGGDLVSFAEAARVQTVVDAIFASAGELVTGLD